MIKKFYLTLRWDTNRYYYFGSEFPGSNANEGVHHIQQSSRTDAV